MSEDGTITNRDKELCASETRARPRRLPTDSVSTETTGPTSVDRAASEARVWSGRVERDECDSIGRAKQSAKNQRTACSGQSLAKATCSVPLADKPRSRATFQSKQVHIALAARVFGKIPSPLLTGKLIRPFRTSDAFASTDRRSGHADNEELSETWPRATRLSRRIWT